MKDYYKILEIEENATDDDIKKSSTVINGLGLRVPTQIYDIDEKYLLQKNNWKSIEDYEKGLNEFKDMVREG